MSLVRPLSVLPHAGKSIPSARISKVRSFNALSDKVNTLSDEYAIMHEVLDGLLPILEARAGLLMVSTELMCTEYHHPSEPLVRFERVLRERGEKMLSLFVLERRQRIHYADDLMLIPLVWQEKPIGLFAFDRERKRLLPSDEAGLRSLSNQLAAIFGLKLQLSQRSRDKGIRQIDIDNAVAVQQSLLPSIPPSHTCGLSIATHTQAADYIGGDYFDLILVDQNKMGIVIADVEGKGVPAALFGNMLRTTVHFLTRETPSTASVVGKINSILHKDAVALQKLFTLFYAVYDSTDKVLTYTGSGHVCPLVIRAESEKAERLHSDGTLIGIEPVQRFSERSVQLHTDDLIALFTDGLTEHQNEAGQIFGEQRLLQLLQAHKAEAVEILMKTLLAELSRFTQRLRTDDLTIILTKIL
jgi:serine phosphatase RsbU (regulator of sigma subunit)